MGAQAVLHQIAPQSAPGAKSEGIVLVPGCRDSYFCSRTVFHGATRAMDCHPGHAVNHVPYREYEWRSVNDYA